MPWNTVLNAIILYLFVIIAMRLLGKKEVGQLSIADLVFVMLVSEIVGDIMRASEDTIWGAIIAVITIMIINKILEITIYKSKALNRLVQGSPAILICHGEPNKIEMDKNKISIEELEQIGREHGKGDISEIELAILEVDGKISILDNVHIKSSTETER
ncbi:DUF421 domain-containing protein [Dysgonomonas sp. Marseille-P4677]|uniref:DUF421 domain-containing protein n=1 Tax=Dysgonomonas sp. Marseille-P4677 TaxID=2364790 RepID=UPI0019133B06|nr:YetF domain-containing protein [Dysgonomonas sp. Marseille-P4677]MBK5722912.1 DUF421 domain-containing protein [Dysgonomonas sp. Marseille-P4677]